MWICVDEHFRVLIEHQPFYPLLIGREEHLNFGDLVLFVEDVKRIHNCLHRLHRRSIAQLHAESIGVAVFVPLNTCHTKAAKLLVRFLFEYLLTEENCFGNHLLLSLFGDELLALDLRKQQLFFLHERLVVAICLELRKLGVKECQKALNLAF